MGLGFQLMSPEVRLASPPCIRAHTHTHIHTRIHRHILTCIHTGTHTQRHLHILTYRHTCTHTHTHTHVHAHTLSPTLYIFLSTSELQPRGRTSDADLQELHCWVLRPWCLCAVWSSPLGPGRASPLAQVTARQYPQWQFTIKAVQAWFDHRSCAGA